MQDALVAAAAECPTTVAGARAVAGEQHRADVGGASCMIEGPVELVDGMRAKRIADLWPVEGDAHDPVVAALADMSVVCDVGEFVEAGHLSPLGGIERVLGGRGTGISHETSLRHVF